VLKISPPVNENNIDIFKKNLISAPSVFSFEGISDFIKFNFSRVDKSHDEFILTPFNLTKKIKLKLHKLCLKLNWLDDETIINNLKLPDVDTIKHAPFNYKYVFDYVSTHKTFSYNHDLCVTEKLLTAPVNQKKFKLFYSI
jgi:hypothetical protein